MIGKTRAQTLCLGSALVCQWDVRAARVLATAAPGRLAVAYEDEGTMLIIHGSTVLGVIAAHMVERRQS
jgi:hypothetical protein